jgi:predicted nuclease of predicted toxin-antitoxin system
MVRSAYHDNDRVVLTRDLDFSAILAAAHGIKQSVAQLRVEGR